MGCTGEAANPKFSGARVLQPSLPASNLLTSQRLVATAREEGQVVNSLQLKAKTKSTQ